MKKVFTCFFRSLSASVSKMKSFEVIPCGNISKKEPQKLETNLERLISSLVALSGPIDRLNAMLPLLHHLDRYRPVCDREVRLGGPISPYLASTHRQDFSTASTGFSTAIELSTAGGH